MNEKISAFLANRNKNRIVFITGAGISAESGIQTFRDHNGLWNKYRVEDVCSMNTFHKNYKDVHKFYNKRRIELGKVNPNAAHKFLANIQKEFGEDRVSIITTNIDDLHERAGSTNVLHVHGLLTEVIEPFTWEEYAIKKIGYTEWKPMDGIVSKPNVMFFGEQWVYTNGRRREPYKDMEQIIFNLNENDIVFIIGCSHTVVNFSEYFSPEHSKFEHPSKVFSVDVNIKNTPFHHDFSTFITKRATDSIEDMMDIIKEKYNK